MVEWFSWVQIAVALVVGLIAIGMAVAKRGPNDVTVLGLALVELLLVVQLVLAIVAPLTGNPMLGNALEFWM